MAKPGVKLTHSAAAWRAKVCVRPGATAFYYYRVGLAADAKGSVFYETRTNPYAPTTAHATLGTVNKLPAATTCAALGAHDRTSR